MMFRLACTVALILVAFGNAASAEVIFDNGDSLHLQPGLAGGTAVDDFVLQDGANTITDLHWWGYYLPSTSTDDFTIFIYDDYDNAPIYTIDGAATVRQDTIYDLSPGPGYLPEYYYSLDIDPLTLTVGQTYWIGINNNAQWYWTFSSTGSGNTQIIEPSQQPTHWALAFQLTGTVVPEPASVLILSAGLASLGLYRRARP